MANKPHIKTRLIPAVLLPMLIYACSPGIITGANAADPGSLSSSHINPILEDRDGKLWIGSGNGLNLYDRGRDRFRRYYLDPPDADKDGGPS